MTLANRDGMSISALRHLGLHYYLIINGKVYSSIFFGWTAATRYEDVRCVKRNRGGALVKLVRGTIRQFFECPLILVDVIAKADF